MNEQKFDELINQTLKEQANEAVPPPSLDLWPKIARQLQNQAGSLNELEPELFDTGKTIGKMRDWRKYTMLGMGLAAGLALLILAIPILGLLTGKDVRTVGEINATATLTSGPVVVATPTIPSTAQISTPNPLNATLSGHSGNVFKVAWSPDGKVLASAGEDKTVRLWAVNGNALAVLTHPDDVTGLEWSADNILYTSSKGNIRVWKADGTFIKALSGGQITAFSLSLQNNLLATSDFSNVKISDTNDNSIKTVIINSSGKAFSLAWSPDGKILVGGELDLRLWQNDGTPIWYASGYSDANIAWSDRNKGEGTPLKDKVAAPIMDIKWSPDGKSFATISSSGTVQIWGVDGKLIATVPMQTTPTSTGGERVPAWSKAQISWSPDGKKLAAASIVSNDVLIWQADTKASSFLKGQTAQITSFAWSPDSAFLASGSTDNNIDFWRIRDGQLLLIFRGHSGAVNSLAWSPTEPIVASGSADKTVKFWPVGTDPALKPAPAPNPPAKTGVLLSVFTGPDAIAGVVWSPDGTKLASIDKTGTLIVWNKDGSRVISRTLNNQPNSGNFRSRALDWSPDGRIIAVGVDNQIYLLLSNDGNFSGQLNETNLKFDGSLAKLAWSPDGRTLAAISDSGGKGRLWNTKGDVLADLPGVDFSLAWSPDGSLLATGTNNGKIMLWSPAGAKMAEFGYNTGSPIFSLNWSPDGAWLTALGKDGQIKNWVQQQGNWSSFEPPFQYYNDGTAINHIIVWSPAKMVLATGSNDGKIRLYYPDALPVDTFVSPGGGFITSVAWSPDSNTLATAGNDNTIRLWSLKLPGQSWDSTVKQPPGLTPTPLTFDNGKVEWVWRVGSTMLVQPSGIAVDNGGRVYIVDALSNSLTKYDVKGKLINSWPLPKSSPGKAKFVAVDNVQNFVYVADSGLGIVQKLDRTGQVVASWDDHLGTITGIAVVGQNEIFVADENCISKFDASGVFLSRWGFQACGGSERGSRIESIAADSQGNIYLSEWGAPRILKYDHNGKFLADIQPDPKDTTRWQFQARSAIALDASGNIYLLSRNTDRIQKFSPDGQLLAEWGGNGNGDGKFKNASALAVDGQGNVYVADMNNGQVQKFQVK